MSVKVFIDGSAGTTGLRIADRLAARPEIELLSISEEGRKDVNERAKVINSADLAFLCLPDAACRHIGEGEPEGRAFAGLGSQSDIASHVLYQHLADG